MDPARCMGAPLSANNLTPSSHAGKPCNLRHDGDTGSYVQLARETMSSSSSGIALSESSTSWSLGTPSKGGDVSPEVQGSVDDACEEPLCPR